MNHTESRKRSSQSTSRKYLYGIIFHSGKTDWEEKGVQGSDVYCLPYRDIGALVSDISEASLEMAEENILAQECVVDRAMEDVPILPMRFGTILDKEEKILALLRNYYYDFMENLQRVKGKVELGVKILWEPNEIIREQHVNLNEKIKMIYQRPEKLSPARRYFLEKLKEHLIERATQREVQALIADVHPKLERYAEGSCLKRMVSPKMMFNASYLVLREKIDDFKKEFQNVRKQHRRLAFLYSGPWPPYSFITVEPQEKILSVEEREK